MSRGPIANAGSLLLSDSSVLPFLAPRLLRPLPANKSTWRNHTSPEWSSSRRETRCISGGLTRNNLLRSGTGAEGKQGASTFHTSSTGSRYALISTFVRCHAQQYSTQTEYKRQEDLKVQDGGETAPHEWQENDSGVAEHRARLLSTHVDAIPPKEAEAQVGSATDNSRSGTSLDHTNNASTQSGIKYRRVIPGPSKNRVSVARFGYKWLSGRRKRNVIRYIKEHGGQSNLALSLKARRIELGRLYLESCQQRQRRSFADMLRWFRQMGVTHWWEALWLENITLLNAKHNSPSSAQDGVPPLRMHETATQLAEQILDANDTNISEIWTQLDQKARLRWRYQVLLWLLDRAPARAADFLVLLAEKEGNFYRYMIDDAIRYLLKLSKPSKHGVDDIVANVVPAYLRIAKARPTMGDYLDRELLLDLVNISTLEQKAELYETFQDALQPRNSFHLRFAMNYAQLGRHDDALGALRRILDNHVDQNSDEFHKICSAFLWSCGQECDYESVTELASGLIEMGVHFNVIHFNILMLNAVKGNDPRTAFDLYDTMDHRGLTSDPYTYSILLKACRVAIADGGNRGAIRQIARRCAEKSMELRNPVVATEYLFYRYDGLRKVGRNSLLPMLESYSRFFDPTPLAELGLIQQQKADSLRSWQKQEYGSEFEPMQPELPALYFMLVCRLQFDPGDRKIMELYESFRRRVIEGHALLGPMTETVHAYNAFILACSQRRDLLKYATKIVRDMCEDLPETAMHRRKNRRLVQARPDVYTWTILIKGFMTHQQPVAAERVLKLMGERQLEPTDVTWSTLLEGYASAQDVDKAMGVVLAMEKYGYALQEKDLVSLNRIKNKDKLIQAVQQLENQARGSRSVKLGPQYKTMQPKSSRGVDE